MRAGHLILVFTVGPVGLVPGAPTRAAATAGNVDGWQLLLTKLTPDNRFMRVKSTGLLAIKEGPNPKLAFKTQGGQVKTVPLAAVITAARPGFTSNSAGKWRVYLKDGGWICGRVITSHGENFHIQTSFGMVSVPLNDALGAGKGRKGFQHPRAAAHDRLFYASGGVLKGTFMQATAGGVRIHTTLGTQWTPWMRIQRIVLGGLPAHTSTVAGFSVALLNGSMLKAAAVYLSRQILTIRTVIGFTLTIPLSAAGEIDTLTGNATWLASLQPIAYRQTPLFGRPWPLQRNHNAVGEPLEVDGNAYSHGIGLHAPCTVTYQLGGRYRYLLLAAQMDDSAQEIGRGRMTIRIGGQPVYRSKVLTTGMPLTFIKLPLRGADRLTITTRPTSILATRCRIDLLDAALLRK